MAILKALTLIALLFASTGCVDVQNNRTLLKLTQQGNSVA